MSPNSVLLSAVGIIAISIFIIKSLNLIWTHLRPSRLSRFAHVSRDGAAPWALVTGASDGIGRAFAQELAAAGFNVALHGRNQRKLDAVAGHLRSTFPRGEFLVLVADASLIPCTACVEASRTMPELEAIRQQLSGRHLTVLINNAGGGSRSFETVSAEPEISFSRIISLNALFPVYLCRTLLPQLMRSGGPSLVMNISSMGDDGFPLVASYSASKSFLMTATTAMRLEAAMNDDQVEVLGIKVGITTGTQNCAEPSSTFVPTAEAMAKAALAKAGYGGGVMVGYWSHALLDWAAGLFSVLPRWVEDLVKINALLKAKDDFVQGAKKA